jgi:hypothetical protein
MRRDRIVNNANIDRASREHLAAASFHLSNY